MTEFDKSQIIPGMAYFAATGPAGKECGDCKSYGDGHGHSCGKWREMMKSENPGPEFDPRVRACKYFAPAPKARTALWGKR